MATWGSQTWGYQNWGTLGDNDVPLTGISASANIGTLTTDTEVNKGWGSDTWGTETWGISGLLVSVTGISLSANLGTVTTTANADVVPTGIQITGALGDEEAFASFTQEVTGAAMTATLSFDPEIVSLTGIAMTANLGTAVLDANTIAEVSTSVPSYWGSSTWGLGVWGNHPIQTLAMTSDEGTVDPSPDATVTGIGVSASLAVGTVVVGEANVTVVGQGIAMGLGLGTLDAVTFADITGIPMSSNLGSVSVTGSATTLCTGIQLTMATNSVNALIWNEVNTGSAPLDPPGWVEVPTRAA